MVATVMPVTSVSASAIEDLTVTIDTGEEVTLTDTDADGYYDIGTADEFYAFASAVNNEHEDSIYGELTADIVVNESKMSAETDSEAVRHWTPIGCDSYRGKFDGNNHSISGLYFNDATISEVGVFGNIVEDCEIENLTLLNSYFYGAFYVGGIAGCVYDSTIENCINKSDIESECSLGGIAGFINTSTVIACANEGKLTGAETCTSYAPMIGGIIGACLSSNIYDSYNKGEINAVYPLAIDAEIGGVVAYCYNTIIDNCYNEGEIFANGVGVMAGGIVGFGIDNSRITNCYNIADIKGNVRYVGGIVAENESTIKNCYNTGDVSIAGTDTESHFYIGGISGMNLGKGIIANCYNTGDVSVTGNYNYCSQGGVIGIDYNTDNITNNYYLNTTCDDSIWNSNVPGSTEAKTAEQFAGGEVAYLLQAGVTAEEGDEIPEIWGQKIGTNELPALGGDKVYKAYNCKDEFVGYSNNNLTVHYEEVLVEGKEPSCTETGLRPRKKCSECGEILQEQEEIPTLPHIPEMIPGKDPSCTETGLTNGEKCTVCGETVVAQEEIPALSHTEETIKGKEATCTIPGLTDGKKCTACGEITVEQEVIEATGHSYKNAKCTICGYKDPVNSTTIYVKPSSNWKKDNARFAAYLWTDFETTFIDMEDTDGDGYYELTAEKDAWDNIIFCRLSSEVETSWVNVWNQTKDLAILKDDRNCFTIQEGVWSGTDGKWSVYTPATAVSIKGEIDLTLEETEKNIFTGTVELEEGTYLFNVAHNGALLGFNSTYTDTATIDYSAGDTPATKLDATGGKYTFTYNASTKTLTIDYEPVQLLGDVNGDGNISVVDVIFVLKHIVGEIALDEEQSLRADVNSNGSITLVDALNIQKMILEIV